MKPPHIYAEWLPLLDRFRNGDNEALAEMAGGTLEWTNVVAERWTRQVVDCLDQRLQALSRGLQAALDRAGDQMAIGNAMLVARRALEQLRQFSALDAAPSNVRELMSTAVEGWAKRTQETLERHAQLVRNDQGQLLKTIRDHPLTARPTAAPSEPVGDSYPPARGRRVIL